MKIVILATFALLFGQTFAAGPVGHLYFTQMLFDQTKNYSSEQKSQFIVGTLFPDIRYLHVCEREETHYSAITLKEVMSEANPFFAGMKYHSYIDLIRDQYVQQTDINKVIAEYSVSEINSFIKFLEDELLFDQVEPLSLGTIQEEELQFGISQSKVQKWHHIMSLFAAFRPTTLFWLFELSGQTFGSLTKEQIKEWNAAFKVALKDERVIEYVKGLQKALQAKILQDLNQS